MQITDKEHNMIGFNSNKCALFYEAFFILLNNLYYNIFVLYLLKKNDKYEKTQLQRCALQGRGYCKKP